MKNPLAVFWFRRDLRLHDNHGLFKALSSGLPVLPIFIFDPEILENLEDNADARVSFIHNRLVEMSHELEKTGSGITVYYGKPPDIFRQLAEKFIIESVFTNRDYEPYAEKRDDEVAKYLIKKGISVHTYKDQVVFEKNEVVKGDGTPYTVFTPYMKKWKSLFTDDKAEGYPSEQKLDALLKPQATMPSLGAMGFAMSEIHVPNLKTDQTTISNYEAARNFPAVDGTTYAGTYLRFGLISPRELIRLGKKHSDTFWNEMIWREFFIQIIGHFPHVVHQNFNARYNHISWRNNEEEFRRWCEGRTGYPMVDAGMRQLNQTGLMHNRLRMVTASFLCKHLLIDWRWGEAYFASRLLDFELASNNGNWQWAAGTGCDAAPYFRVFNPTEQARKFDAKGQYIRKWVPEIDELHYPKPIVEHTFARNRAIKTYKEALEMEQ
jgi:deoxyribodipyrimidine photo-lyase